MGQKRINMEDSLHRLLDFLIVLRVVRENLVFHGGYVRHSYFFKPNQLENYLAKMMKLQYRP